MRQDRSRIRQVRLSCLSGYPGCPKATRVIARLSRLSYQVIWVTYEVISQISLSYGKRSIKRK
jgi:hypothetical protein